MDAPPEICPHCGTSHKPIVQKYNVTMQHKHRKGNKVRIIEPHKTAGKIGVVVALMPYTFVAPAYDVLINGVIVAVSERSLEKIESTSQKDIDEAL